MFWRVLLAVALTLTILYLWQRFRLTKAQVARAKAAGRRPLTLPNVGVGGVVSVRGLAEGEKNFVVSKRNRYSQGGSDWYELVSEDGTQEVYLEYEEDDRLEVSLSQQSEERLADLGLSEEDLIRFDEEEDGTFEHDGAQWRLTESAEAFYHEDSRPGSGEGFYYWDFKEPDGERMLTVERYEGEPFTVWRGRKVRPEDVSVWSLEAEEAATA